MKILFRYLRVVAVSGALAHLSCYGETTDETQQYTDVLRGHYNQRTFQKVRDEFRERLANDNEGILIDEMLRERVLRKLLFANFDAAPDRWIDQILAEYLEDGSQWESQGELFRSPADGIAAFITERLKPRDSENLTPPDALSRILSHETTRLKVAKILRRLSSSYDNFPPSVTERRAIAWSQLLGVVNASHEPLLEKDEQRSVPNKSNFRAISPNNKSLNRDATDQTVATRPHNLTGRVAAWWTGSILSLIVLSVIGWIIWRRKG